MLILEILWFLCVCFCAQKYFLGGQEIRGALRGWFNQNREVSEISEEEKREDWDYWRNDNWKGMTPPKKIRHRFKGNSEVFLDGYRCYSLRLRYNLFSLLLAVDTLILAHKFDNLGWMSWAIFGVVVLVFKLLKNYCKITSSFRSVAIRVKNVLLEGLKNSW